MWVFAVLAVAWLTFGRHWMWGGGCPNSRRIPMRDRDILEWRREKRWRAKHGWTRADDEAWEKGGEARRIERREDPVKQAQRLWIDGRITDEEYERRLDAVYSGSLRVV